jgi:two-component system sensor histidine kinase BaeS
MFRTLRIRLILSHVIPMLVITPIMAVVLIYALETRIIVPNLTQQLVGEALLTSELTRDQTQLWTDPSYARSVLQRVDAELTERVMLLAPNGLILASSDSRDNPRLDTVLKIPDMAMLREGKIVTQSGYSVTLNSDVSDVYVPVIDSNHKMVGIVRITFPLVSVYSRFLQLRFLIIAVMTSGLIFGTIVGSILALDISRPILQAAQAVYNLALGNKLDTMPETGSEEIRLLVRSVNILVDRLHDLEEARRQLLANLIHELGRPLGAIRSAIHALLKGAMLNPQLGAELLEGMDDETLQLQTILDDLSHLHEQVLGPLELKRKPVTISEWLPRVLIPWRSAALEKKQHWNMEIQSNLPVIEIDPARIAQAVGNLVSNAIKFTPPMGTVSVAARGDEKAVWIEVSDTGPGIPLSELEQILKPYYRGRRMRRFPQGMGLGLGIAQSLVVAHGGRLDIKSTPGLGSQFTIWLPITKQSASAEIDWQL